MKRVLAYLLIWLALMASAVVVGRSQGCANAGFLTMKCLTGQEP
jgi:hypothetical protein